MSIRLTFDGLSVRCFADDECGATLLTFGLFLTLLLGGMGVGMDITMAKRTQAHAQQAADDIAREAAAFWERHDRRPGPNDNGVFAHNVVYSAQNAGLDFGTTVEDDVKFKVSYNGGRRVQVTLWGASRTTLSAAFGYDEIGFVVISTVRTNEV